MIPAAPIEIVHSAPGSAPSDDAFGLLYRPGVLHAWVIDGATSVSARPNKVLPHLSDAGWFARALSRELTTCLRHGELTDGALGRALSYLRNRFVARAGPNLDHHDFPVAAMTYLRVSRDGARYVVDSLEFADCFHLTVPSARTRPSPAFPLPPPLPKIGLPETGPMIERMRQRRDAQVRDLSSTAVTIDAASVVRGHRSRRLVDMESDIILGSDGYARVWTEYALQTQAAAMADLTQFGAARGLHKLRTWERANLGHGRSPKAADDVTVLRFRLGAPTGRGHVVRNRTSMIWRATPMGHVEAQHLLPADDLRA